jgi:hypothetical protein
MSLLHACCWYHSVMPVMEMEIRIKTSHALQQTAWSIFLAANGVLCTAFDDPKWPSIVSFYRLGLVSLLHVSGECTEGVNEAARIRGIFLLDILGQTG